jgi:hypothetical protein
MTVWRSTLKGMNWPWLRKVWNSLRAQAWASGVRWRVGAGLGGRGVLAGNGRGWEGSLLDGKEWLAGDAVEEVEEALLGGLRDGVDGLAVAVDGEQCWRRGEVAVPDVVMDALEVPEALAGVGVEGEECVGEEVVADAIGAVEVTYRGACRDVDDAALGVDGHPCPVVGCSCGLPGVCRPGLVAVFAGEWNGVEGPAELTGVDVEGADVAVERGLRLGQAEAENDGVLVDDAWCGRGKELCAVVATGEAIAQVELASVAEGGDELAVGGVECVEVRECPGEEDAAVAVGPVAEAS